MGKREKRERESLKQQLSTMFEVPPEIVNDLPKITLLGNKEITVENFGGLIEYTMQKIRLSTKSGILVIDGIDLQARKMTADYIIIKGTILQIVFLQ